MNTLLSRHASVRPAALAALFAALLAALLTLGAPAQAHDSLLESDPADGATLETSPEAITLTFSADILEVSPLVRITDGNGEVREVEGPGVVGEQPVLDPGSVHRYTSGAVLATPVGSMEGTYEMHEAGGRVFRARIPRFRLERPGVVQ